ncbi:hypothetical protein HIM_09103 [Hirsutella minnesotensis 3608]|uniref:Rhamnolipids biosynthesis 3-oxoacyl-[acyl-carrier-protein] reductase n=1 Tax=Hirsutella minnesotensis 3608 TaxID=1043627 RepID=A0A0F7ZLW3_9HYPO|nr:hypothetical protein HIM_09103 [Hirsutella minnesotensis 3608]
MASTDVLRKESLFDLSGKVALVTGGGSGIGLMTAQALCANGAKVYVLGRTKEKLETVAQVHGKGGAGEMIPIQADVNTKESVKTLVEEIKSREKCLCILVNNAGIAGEIFPVSENKSAEEVRKSLFDSDKATYDEWLDIYRTNVTAVYFTTCAFLPLLQASSERHPGWSAAVINVGSVSGHVKTAQHHFSYNTSKAAVGHLTRMMANEFAQAGLKIRINNLAPGVFPSEMTTNASDKAQKSGIPKEKFEGKVPADRPGKDDDMAQGMLFLAANQYINGQTIAIDGGMTLSYGL